MRIFLLEDNEIISGVYRDQLPKHGVNIEIQNLSEQGASHMAATSDADIVAIGMPQIENEFDVTDMIKDIRQRGFKNGIMVFLNNKNTPLAVSAIDAGADDVLERPIKPELIAAKMRAMVRRINGNTDSEIVVGSLVYPLDGREVTLNGNSFSLTRKERALMNCLVTRANLQVHRDTIFTSMYGMASSDVDRKIIDVFVCRLRKRIEELGGGVVLDTVYSYGYMLKPEEQAVEKKEELKAELSV